MNAEQKQSLTGAFLILCIAIALLGWIEYHRAKDHPAHDWTPRNGHCEQQHGAEFDGYHPMHVLEQHALRNMAHKTGVKTQRCSAEIDGHQVEFQIDQIWVADVVGTELPRVHE